MMIQMFVTGVGFEETTGQPVVLLNDSEQKHALPILIGMQEAGAISRAVQRLGLRHRTTHRLICEMMSTFGYDLDRAEITLTPDGAYTGKLFMVPNGTSGQAIEFGARPTDAIILSLIEKAPLLVTEEILTRRGIELKTAEELRDEDQFKEFVGSLKASDFNKFGSGPAEPPD